MISASRVLRYFAAMHDRFSPWPSVPPNEPPAPAIENPAPMNVAQIRRHFPAIVAGRVVTNNAASTQLPDSLLDFYYELAPFYENVHRGQSSASKRTTILFEQSYKIIADFVGSRSWKEIVLYRGTTEAINAVMYSLMTEFRDGDNVVSTYLEHNSNYVPWYGMTKEILPHFGINVECRLARFDRKTGELDLDHMAQLVDKNTKLVCCSGASNFLGTKPPLDKVREIAATSGYIQPNGMRRSYLLVDGAQLVPNAYVDVTNSDIDFLAWSFHKMFAPVGVGALYAKEEILESMRPFQYGGDMIAQGEVAPNHVGYNSLPWKFTAGTPNILGSILAAGAIEFLIEMVLGTFKEISCDSISQFLPECSQIKKAMSAIEDYEMTLSAYLIEGLSRINGLNIYGPKNPARRTAVVAFNINNKDPIGISDYLANRGIESRAGCHCATLAHYFYGLTPPASCRISPYIYNTTQEMDAIVNAVESISLERTLCPVAG